MSRNRRPGRRAPVIGHREILSRARSDLQREMAALNRRMMEEGLPDDCYAEELRVLDGKLSAVNTMLYYECGEYC